MLAHMRAAGLAELLVAGIGELGVGHAGVVGAGDALDQPGGDEAIDQPGDPRAGQHRALGQGRHRKLAVRGLGEVEQDLVVPSGDAVLGHELGVEPAHDRRVALQIAAPRLEGRALELSLSESVHAIYPS